jgi:hypothetical protein
MFEPVHTGLYLAPPPDGHPPTPLQKTGDSGRYLTHLKNSTG